MKEREEEGVKRKKNNKNNNNKELLKKKKKLACRPSWFCWSFLAVANSGSLAQLFSVQTSTHAASDPALQRHPGPTGSGTHPPRGYGMCVCTGPSLIRTLPGAFGLTSL